jgi:hypothetical protein
MRETSAICVGSVESAIQLRALGVNELTIGRTVLFEPPVDWKLYEETVNQIGPDGVGVHVWSVDDITRAHSFRAQIHHVGVNFHRWFLPETRAALERAAIPIRFSGLDLDLEDVPDWIPEHIHRAALPSDARVILSLLAEVDDPFLALHREFRPWNDGPTAEELKGVVESTSVSICTKWHFRKRRRWFLEQLPDDTRITLIVSDEDFQCALPQGMDLAAASQFVREVRRLDSRREGSLLAKGG